MVFDFIGLFSAFVLGILVGVFIFKEKYDSKIHNTKSYVVFLEHYLSRFVVMNCENPGCHDKAKEYMDYVGYHNELEDERL